MRYRCRKCGKAFFSYTLCYIDHEIVFTRKTQYQASDFTGEGMPMIWNIPIENERLCRTHDTNMAITDYEHI